MSRQESDLRFDAEERSAVVHSMLGNAMPPCATPEQMDHREEGSELGRSARGLLAYIAGVEAWARADERREVALDTAAGIVDPELRAALRDEVLIDLLGEMQALPVFYVQLRDDSYVLRRNQVLRRADVLALLKGGE